jgi:hypothetical protein
MAASTVSEHLCLVIGDHATAKASGRIEGSRQRTHAAAMRRRDNRHGGGCLAARTCMSRPRPLPADLPDASRRRPRGRNRLRPRESSRLLPHERLDASPRVASWRRAPSPSTCASRLSITRPRKRPAGSRGVASARTPAVTRRRDNRHGGSCLAARTCMSRARPLPADLPDASRGRPRGRGRLRPRESSRLLPHERLDALPRVASWRRAPSPSTCAS